MDSRKSAGPWGKPAPHPPSPPSAPRRLPWGAILIVLVLGAGIVAGLAALGVPLTIAPSDGPYLVGLSIAGIVIVLRFARQRRPGAVAVQAAVWVALFVAIIAGYGFRHELREAGARVLAVIVPSYGYHANAATVSFPVSNDGHYWVNGQANGVAVRFLVDTGATGIVLTKDDAQRLGLNPDALSYDRMVSTANGMTHAAPITLHELAIGPIALNDIAASVNEGELSNSLLGMRFLERVGSIEIKDGTLTLHR